MKNAKPTFIMMCGLPGSGKSGYAEELANDYNCTVHSSDTIREELTGDINCQEKDEEVFRLLHDRIKKNLTNGEHCIYDACNINQKRRKAFLDELRNIECQKVIYWIYTPYNKCLANNANRFRTVPEQVIERMYRNFYPPYWFEGWDDIFIIENQVEYKTKDFLFYGEQFEPFSNNENKQKGLCEIRHDNPHHSFSIGDHCINTYLRVLDKTAGKDFNLCMAALLHDIGKPFVKSNLNAKGKVDTRSHYYQHHHVSAYDAIKYLDGVSVIDKLEIVQLIVNHMFPFFWEKDDNRKMKDKYRKLWDDDFYSRLMILHEADKESH